MMTDGVCWDLIGWRDRDRCYGIIKIVQCWIGTQSVCLFMASVYGETVGDAAVERAEQNGRRRWND